MTSYDQISAVRVYWNADAIAKKGSHCIKPVGAFTGKNSQFQQSHSNEHHAPDVNIARFIIGSTVQHRGHFCPGRDDVQRVSASPVFLVFVEFSWGRPHELPPLPVVTLGVLLLVR